MEITEVRLEESLGTSFLEQIIHQTLGLQADKLLLYQALQKKMVEEEIVADQEEKTFSYMAHPHRGRDLLISASLKTQYDSKEDLAKELQARGFQFSPADTLLPSNNHHFRNGEYFKKEHMGFFLNYQGCSFHLLNPAV